MIQTKIKDPMQYTQTLPALLPAQEMPQDAVFYLQQCYPYQARGYWLDPYPEQVKTKNGYAIKNESGFYILAFATDLQALDAYCLANGYRKDVDVHTIYGYELVDLAASFAQGKPCIIDKTTISGVPDRL